MALNYFNRYKTLSSDEKQSSAPFVKLTNKSTDQFTVYEVGKSRLDKISQQYYSAPYYGWLILMANPDVASSEWEIPNNTTIRIPFPLSQTLNEYENKLQKRIDYYGE